MGKPKYRSPYKCPSNGVENDIGIVVMEEEVESDGNSMWYDASMEAMLVARVEEEVGRKMKVLEARMVQRFSDLKLELEAKLQREIEQLKQTLVIPQRRKQQQEEMCLKKRNIKREVIKDSEVEDDPQSENESHCDDENAHDAPMFHGLNKDLIREMIKGNCEIKQKEAQKTQNTFNDFAAVLPSNGVMESHQALTANAEPNEFLCEFCSKSFSIVRDLVEHERTHSGSSRPYSCSVCGSRFRESASLKAHSRIHTGERPYICDVCSQSFISASNLKMHIRLHSDEHTGAHTCDMCGQSFDASSNLTVHLKTHASRQDYQCSSCSKWFKNSATLEQHTMVHTGERPHECPVCGRGFTHAVERNRHRATHDRQFESVPTSRPKPKHTCPVCFKVYVQYSSFKLHKMTHTAERLFKCDLCDRGFIGPMSLKKHQRAHKKHEQCIKIELPEPHFMSQ